MTQIDVLYPSRFKGQPEKKFVPHYLPSKAFMHLLGPAD
jgi:hypothetical protein